MSKKKIQSKNKNDTISVWNKILDILRNEGNDANKKANDPFWTGIDTGHNIGTDMQIALKYAHMAIREPVANESIKEYLEEIRRCLYKQKCAYERVNADPAGFGIGTFGDIFSDIDEYIQEMGLDVSSFSEYQEGVEDNHEKNELTPLANLFNNKNDYFDIEHSISDSDHMIKMNLWKCEYLTVIDFLQIKNLLLAIKLFFVIPNAEEAELLLYSIQFKKIQSLFVEILKKTVFPKKHVKKLMRHIYGCNAILSYIQTREIEKETSNGVEKYIFPLTLFSIDLDRGKVESERIKNGNIFDYDGDGPSAFAYRAVESLAKIMNDESFKFLSQMFSIPDLSNNPKLSDSAILGYFNLATIDDDWNVSNNCNASHCICCKIDCENEFEIMIHQIGEYDEITPILNRFIIMTGHAASFGSDCSGGDLEIYLKNVSDLLIQKIENFMCETSTIYFILEGILSLVPFNALKLSNGNHLAQQFQVVIANSIRSINQNCDITFSEICNGAIIANPNFEYGDECPLSNDKKFEPLQFTNTEKEAICKLTHWAAIEWDQANRENFISALKEKDAIHIATHGGFLGNQLNLKVSEGIANPSTFFKNQIIVDEQSFIALAGINKNINASIITPKILSAINHIKTKFIYLSLCMSNFGSAIDGESTFSIKRSLLTKAIRAVVANSYPVLDKIATEFAVTFYRYFINGETAIHSIKKTQMQFFDSRTPWFLWCGFHYNI